MAGVNRDFDGDSARKEQHIGEERDGENQKREAGYCHADCIYERQALFNWTCVNFWEFGDMGTLGGTRDTLLHFDLNTTTRSFGSGMRELLMIGDGRGVMGEDSSKMQLGN